MKRTKSMIYNPTVESRELLLYTTNTGELYRRYALPMITNLRRKYQRGQYDPNKAVDLWYRLACAGSDSYNRDFGYSFSVQDRFTAAVDMEEFYREEVEEKEQ